MKKYRVLIEGNNFLITHKSKLVKFGFYVHRYIEAEDIGLAKNDAIKTVKNELSDIYMNKSYDPPSFKINEISEIESFEGISNLTPGIIWYPENDDLET